MIKATSIYAKGWHVLPVGVCHLGNDGWLVVGNLQGRGILGQPTMRPIFVKLDDMAAKQWAREICLSGNAAATSLSATCYASVGKGRKRLHIMGGYMHSPANGTEAVVSIMNSLGKIEKSWIIRPKQRQSTIYLMPSSILVHAIDHENPVIEIAGTAVSNNDQCDFWHMQISLNKLVSSAAATSSKSWRYVCTDGTNSPKRLGDSILVSAALAPDDHTLLAGTLVDGQGRNDLWLIDVEAAQGQFYASWRGGSIGDRQLCSAKCYDPASVLGERTTYPYVVTGLEKNAEDGLNPIVLILEVVHAATNQIQKMAGGRFEFNSGSPRPWMINDATFADQTHVEAVGCIAEVASKSWQGARMKLDYASGALQMTEKQQAGAIDQPDVYVGVEYDSNLAPPVWGILGYNTAYPSGEKLASGPFKFGMWHGGQNHTLTPHEFEEDRRNLGLITGTSPVDLGTSNPGIECLRGKTMNEEVSVHDIGEFRRNKATPEIVQVNLIQTEVEVTDPLTIEPMCRG